MISWSIESAWCKWLGIAAGCVFTVGVAYWYGFTNGSRQAHAEDARRYAVELDKANEVYRAKEDEHAKSTEELRIKYARVDSTETGRDSVVVSQLGTGAKRMRVRTASCPAVPAPGAAPVGTDEPPTCELSPEVGARLYQLAADADQAARQLAALQEWAFSAVKLCNGSKQ